MQKKKDRITPLITLGLSLVFIGALIHQTLPEKKTIEIISQGQFEEAIETELTNNSYVDEISVDDVWIDETEIINEQTSFGKAFAAARAELGEGSTFIWNEKEYTTDLEGEIKDEYLLADSTLETKNNSGKNQISDVPFSSQVTSIK